MPTKPDFGKVALVQDWLTGFAGGEQVLLALHQLFPEAPIYTSLFRPGPTLPFPEAQVHASVLQRIPGASRFHQFLIPLMPQAFEGLNFKEYDTVISIGNLAKGIITHPHQRHINYCHTPIRYLWHLGGDMRTESWLRARVAHSMRLWDTLSAKRPDLMLANSHTTQERIAKIYRRTAPVVYPPVHLGDMPPVERKPKDYYLMLGRLVGYKRPDLVVAAAKEGGWQLKVAGEGPELAKMQALATGSPNIEFLGRVSDATKQTLLHEARGFIFAAEEDFGIAPVEAIAAGCPVLAFGRGGATESVQEGVSGMFFAEQSVASLLVAWQQFAAKTDWDTAAMRKSVEKFSLEQFHKHILHLLTEPLPSTLEG